MLFTRALRRLKRLHFKKNRKYLAGAVIGVGILTSLAIFSFSYLGGASTNSIAMDNVKWSEAAGLGTSVSACASGSMSTSCSGLQGALTLNVSDLHGGSASVFADFWGGPLLWTGGEGSITLTGL